MNTFFVLVQIYKKSFTEWRNRGFWYENQTNKSSCYRMCFFIPVVTNTVVISK
jgi:hypothetical protein